MARQFTSTWQMHPKFSQNIFHRFVRIFREVLSTKDSCMREMIRRKDSFQKNQKEYQKNQKEYLRCQKRCKIMSS